MSVIDSVFHKEVEFIQNLQMHLCEPQYHEAIDLIAKCEGKIVVTGVGKSGHIASKIAATMASTGTPSFFVHPGEACHGDLGMIEEDDLVIAISHSGESSEIMTILPICKKRGIKIVTITANPESSMAKIADVHLCTYVTEEAGPLNLAPTSSTTVTLVLGDAIAIALSEMKKFTKHDFAASHPGGALGKRLLILNENVMKTGDDLPIVHTNNSISETIVEITNKKMGFAIVLNQDDDHLVGIFTDGDLRRILNMKLDLNSTQIKQVTHTHCLTVKPDEKASDSLRIMEEKSITGLVVVDDNEKVIGAFNIHDVLSKGIRR